MDLHNFNSRMLVFLFLKFFFFLLKIFLEIFILKENSMIP
jgi:hypothetical protein